MNSNHTNTFFVVWWPKNKVETGPKNGTEEPSVSLIVFYAKIWHAHLLLVTQSCMTECVCVCCVSSTTSHAFWCVESIKKNCNSTRWNRLCMGNLSTDVSALFVSFISISKTSTCFFLQADTNNIEIETMIDFNW